MGSPILNQMGSSPASGDSVNTLSLLSLALWLVGYEECRLRLKHLLPFYLSCWFLLLRKQWASQVE
jgi:hypothetical protein